MVCSANCVTQINLKWSCEQQYLHYGCVQRQKLTNEHLLCFLCDMNAVSRLAMRG